MYIKDSVSAYFKQPLRYYNSDTKLQYSVFNDSTNIFLLLKATENLSQYKIMQTGIQLQLDSTASFKNKSGIAYPINLKQNHLSTFMLNNDWDTYMSRFQYENIYMKVHGFKGINDQEILVKNSFNLKVSISWDSIGVLYYCASIPMKLIREYTIGDSLMAFGIKIVLSPIASTQDKTNSSENNSVETGYSMYQQKMSMYSNQNARMQATPALNETQSYLSTIRTLKFIYKPVWR